MNQNSNIGRYIISAVVVLVVVGGVMGFAYSQHSVGFGAGNGDQQNGNISDVNSVGGVSTSTIGTDGNGGTSAGIESINNGHKNDDNSGSNVSSGGDNENVFVSDDHGGEESDGNRNVVSTPVDGTSVKYKDGTYSAVGTYDSPAGMESINVTLVIKNDIITGANVVGNARNGTSIRYQQKFISGYKQFVFGKDINTVKLNVISGSSLTPNGFNSALASIKTQAKA
jgi:uncharacterized protein with FMN-binding domain